MKKKIKIIFAICVIAITGVITLQLFWLKNYNTVNRDRFDKEIKSSFEEALKKEYEQRANSIENSFYECLMDTSRVVITSVKKPGSDIYAHTISEAKTKKPYIIFSLDGPTDSINNQWGPAKQKVARGYANDYRTRQFEKNSLSYDSGDTINAVLKKLDEHYRFNLDNFSTLLSEILARKDIYEPFTVHFLDSGNTAEIAQLYTEIGPEYPYFTNKLPTYKFEKDFNYIIAAFKPPNAYLKNKLTLLIVSSVFLILIVGFALYFLIRTIFQEKRLITLKNDFISNISHEFKTPIATASAAIEAMEKFNVLENPERTKKYLTASKNELVRLSELVNKILGISLYEKRQVDLKKETVHIDEMIDTMLHNFSLIRKGNTHIEVTNECDSLVIKADRTHLYNSLSNIVDNALKYGGPDVRVNIRVTCTKQELVIEIKDNGPGIPPRDLPHLFDKFYRVPSKSQMNIKGFGLGLYYTRSIIQEHGGWCKVESEWGKGTTFKIGLPK